MHGLDRFLSVVLARGLPFVLTCLAGLAWGVYVFWYVAPRMLRACSPTPTPSPTPSPTLALPLPLPLILTLRYVAPRMLPSYWAERALVEFGVSIGATSTG